MNLMDLLGEGINVLVRIVLKRLLTLGLTLVPADEVHVGQKFYNRFPLINELLAKSG